MHPRRRRILAANAALIAAAAAMIATSPIEQAWPSTITGPDLSLPSDTQALRLSVDNPNNRELTLLIRWDIAAEAVDGGLLNVIFAGDNVTAAESAVGPVKLAAMDNTRCPAESSCVFDYTLSILGEGQGAVSWSADTWVEWSGLDADAGLQEPTLSLELTE